MKIFLISNMYPSKTQKYFGIFVKNFESNIIKHDIEIPVRALIFGRGKSRIQKLMKYSLFIMTIILGGLFKKFDIIYMHFLGRHSVFVHYFAMITNKPLVINVHGSDVLPEKPFSENHKASVKKSLDYARLIVVPSTYFKEVVINEFSQNRDKIFISPSGGIDPKNFYPIPRANINDFVIGFVSRIDRGKGWDHFIEALNILITERAMPVRAIVAGDGSEKNDLLKKIEVYNLEGNIKILGAVPHDQLGTIFNAMDISNAESLGLVGIEAMACGVPVVGSAIGGILSYLEDGVNGYTFKPGNPIELADKLEKYYNLDSNKKANFKENALKTATLYFNDTITLNLASKLRKINF